MHLGKAKHANAGVTKLPDKAAHASRRLTRTFRDATWPFPAPSADSTISILSKMRCLAYATALSVGPGTALGTGFMPGCSWRGQQKFSTALRTALSNMYGHFSRLLHVYQNLYHDRPPAQHWPKRSSPGTYALCAHPSPQRFYELLLGTSQPGWEDLGWENASYWMVCLNNACSHCKLQLEEVALPRGYREEYVQPRSSPQAMSPEEARFWQSGVRWGILKLMAKRQWNHNTPQDTPLTPSMMNNGAPAS